LDAKQNYVRARISEAPDELDSSEPTVRG
jgi:hypothetical protein